MHFLQLVVLPHRYGQYLRCWGSLRISTCGEVAQRRRSFWERCWFFLKRMFACQIHSTEIMKYHGNSPTWIWWGIGSWEIPVDPRFVRRETSWCIQKWFLIGYHYRFRTVFSIAFSIQRELLDVKLSCWADTAPMLCSILNLESSPKEYPTYMRHLHSKSYKISPWLDRFP